MESIEYGVVVVLQPVVVVLVGMIVHPSGWVKLDDVKVDDGGNGFLGCCGVW